MRAKGPYRVILTEADGSEFINNEVETLKAARQTMKDVHAEYQSHYPQTDFDTKVYDANGVCIEHLYNVADSAT